MLGSEDLLPNEDLLEAMTIANEFLRMSREYLAGEYLPKIERSLSLLSEEQIWWRPNDHSNSIGNLVLHLSGNARQWIVSGIGGAEDVRQRDTEFAARGAPAAESLLGQLRSTVDDVTSVLDRLDPDSLSDARIIQGRETTVFRALYHVVEHFSMHTGQIIQITKQLTDRDLEFYSFQQERFQKRW